MGRLSASSTRVVARNYANGVWQQYSGSDFVSHLGRSARGWAREAATLKLHRGEQKAARPVLMCVGLSGMTTYAEWITCYGALLQGMDVFFAPEQLSGQELKLCLSYFGVTAIVCDPSLFAERYRNLGVPIYQTEQRTWAPGDRGGFPEAVEAYRNCASTLGLQRSEASFGSSETQGSADKRSRRTKKTLQPLPPVLPTEQKPLADLGDLLFISIGNDGYHRKVRLPLDAFLVTAQNFLLHLNAPSWFEWRSIEMVSLSHPFAHTTRLALILKNGVVGFMNPSMDWQSNLEVLRPSCIAVGPPELQQIATHVTAVRRKTAYRSRVAMSEGLGSVRKYLEGGRSFRLSPNVFGALSKSIRRASQLIVGSSFMAEAAGDLKFIVHGLAPAQKNHVRVLDRLGVPVVETYGKTAACGLLASNTYAEPHLNLIGSPLEHVAFRLGEESVLEYRVTSRHFEDGLAWLPTGDVAQMTPFGYAIIGRKLHQISTRGGVVVSPALFEWRLSESGLISQACIVGDHLPFLGALLVLAPEARTRFEQNPDAVREEVNAVVSKINETLPRNGTIKKFEILSEPFLEVSGEMLPNGAVNRVRVFETRAEAIARIYEDGQKKQSAGDTIGSQDGIPV
jgi:hypothetical protein